MASPSPVNKLQELFQKCGQALPKYTSVKKGEDHTPEYKCTVILADGRQFAGKFFRTKTDAKKDAARIALASIGTTDPFSSKRETFSFNGKGVVVIIDLENKQTIVYDLIEKIQSNGLLIMGVISAGSSLIEKYKKIDDKRFNLWIMPSSRRDAVDVGIIMHITSMLLNQKHNAYIIITSDHFGETLVECVSSANSVACQRVDITSLQNYDDLIRKLKSLP